MSELEFRMLGPLEVLRQGAPVALPPGRPRTLLGMLLVRAGQVMAADVLLDELWRGDPPATAAHALQVYVSKLRKLLEPDRSPGDPSQVLVTRPPGYVLAIPPEACDAGRFELLVGESGRALSDARPEDASRLLRDALALWRGSVLADLNDEPFVTIEAARLEELRAVATERWADAKLALGHHGELVSELEALIRVHPFRERLWGQLMVALYRSGRPTDALHTYQRLRRMLAEQVGTVPSPELQRLESAILRHDPDMAAPAGSPPPGPAPVLPTQSTTAARTSIPPESQTGEESESSDAIASLPRRLAGRHPFPLVGRVHERAVLERAWRRAKGGGLHVVLLAGEPGIGKTRLATEAALVIHRQGGLVLHGACDEELAVPYQPFVEALRHLMSMCREDELAAALSRRGRELTRILPELSRLVADLHPPQTSDPETERYLLFSAVAELLSEVSCRRPGVLVVDDLHWATKPTLLMLKHVIRSGVPMRLLIIGAYRHSDVGRGHPLTGLLAELRREPRVERIHLRGLTTDEAITMMAHVVGRTLEGAELDLARAVHADAGGSPFFMEELVRHLVEVGGLIREGDGWTDQARLSNLGVPDSVREVILHRLSRLSELTEHLLTVGAVVGREFDLAILGQVAELDRSTMLECLDAARRAALVREVEGSPGRYSFVHALIRDALYDELGAARRMDLHRQVAQSLERSGCTDARLAELARHWVASLAATGFQAADAAKAARYAQQAGRRAMSSLAYEEAIDHFRGALHAARQANDETFACDLLIVLGEAQRYAGDPGHRDTLLEAGRLAHRLGDSQRMARAALANQRPAFARTGAYRKRVAALEAALQAVGTTGTSTRARLLAALATEIHFEGEHRLDLAREAVELARQLNDAATLAEALAALWFAAWGSSAESQRSAIATELESVTAKGTDRTLQFQAGMCLFLSATAEGNMQRADEGLSRCVVAAEELGQPLFRWRVATLQVHRAMVAGRFDDAERWARESLQLGEVAAQPDRLAFFTTPLVALRLLQGRPEEVEDLVTPAIEQFPGTVGYVALRTWGLAEAGRMAEANAILDQLRPGRFAGVPHDYIRLFSLCCLSRACSPIGDPGAAAELYDLLLPYRSAMATTQSSWIGPVTHDLGLLATMLGRYDVAEEHFADAVAVQDRIGARGMVVHSRLQWGRMHLRRGGPENAARARTLLGEAEAGAQQVGTPALVPRIRALLAQTDAAEAEASEG